VYDIRYADDHIGKHHEHILAFLTFSSVLSIIEKSICVFCFSILFISVCSAGGMFLFNGLVNYLSRRNIKHGQS